MPPVPQRLAPLRPRPGLVSTRWSGSVALAGLLLLTVRYARAEVDVRVLEDTGDRIVLEVEIGELRTEPVEIDGEPFVQLGLDGGSPWMEVVGDPQVPTVDRSVIVPGDARMEIAVLEAEYEDWSDVQVAPTKGVLLRSVDPADVPHEFGAPYGEDAWFPGDLAALGEPYILRDHRGVVVELFPVQVNPVRGTARVYDRLVVELVRAGDGQVNLLEGRDQPPVEPFETIYRHHFVNHETRGGAKYQPLPDSGEMLIIAADSWVANAQPLADHKNSLGIPTTLVGVGTIGNNASAIESYIQNLYAGSNLTFVLLVGDHSQVASPQSWGSAADPTYATVAGNDSYPDILIGRFSADSAAHVDTQVARTIDYELQPATAQPWFRKATGIGSEEGPGDDNEMDYQHIDHILDDLLAYGYTHADQLFGYGATASGVSQALDDGRGAVAYCGHGWIDGWGTSNFSSSHVNALANTGKLPFVVSVACNVGEFDGGTCFAESWLRATSGGQPAGAIGFYGSSVSQSWNPPMCAQDEVFDVFVAEQYVALGALLFAGSSRMIDEYGQSGATEFDHWHLFGDPSVRIFGQAIAVGGLQVDPGSGFESEGQAGGPFAPVEQVYSLENTGDDALDFEVHVGASWLQATPASGSLPPGGTASVTLELTTAALTLGNGTFGDVVWFRNVTDGQGDTSRPVSLEVGVPQLQHEWLLDDDPGWTVQGDWAWGQPSGGGGEYGGKDPTGGHTGTNVLGYNLQGDYPNGLGQMHLTSAPIDCSGLTKTTLRFRRWLGVESSEYDHAAVLVSRDGQSWTTLWQNSAEVADSQWVEQEFDLSSVADGQPAVYLRWTMGSTDEGWRYCGWNLDDIALYGIGSGDCWDADGDGYPDTACGGDDCDDSAYGTHPNAPEDCGDGVDNDCDGAVDGDDQECGGDQGDDGPDGDLGDDDAGDDDATSQNLVTGSVGTPGACSCRVGAGGPAPGLALALAAWCAGLWLARRRRA